jgi:Fe-S oxidoreductase
VVLFPDTFGNFLHPGPMRAATEVLEDAGFRVVVPTKALCCGRPLYDYGMLTLARRLLERLVDGLRPYVRDGVSVVGVEPSCVAAFRDELVNLLPHDEDARRLSRQAVTLSEFLLREAPEWRAPALHRRAIVHRHCHHQAVMGFDAEAELLERIGLDFQILDSGCCGLAGSFGFEREHHGLSVKIAERRLLPAVREAPEDTLVLADGFSCRTQIEQLTDRRALHIAELIEMGIHRAAPEAARS